MSHPSQDISLSITLTNTAPNTDCAISMVQLETRFVTKEQDPPTFKCQAHMNVVPVQSCQTSRPWCGRRDGIRASCSRFLTVWSQVAGGHVRGSLWYQSL
ncbi:hypothetical protein WMY93_007909 [Mugilogobius chulae]|uniref:Uncharacterized protein n=1 Tax=Mugilogobius chulae TaxID=88201 RepID=A0AAW0PKX5_9GOBI